jgi:hypothetical protein
MTTISGHAGQSRNMVPGLCPSAEALPITADNSSAMTLAFTGDSPLDNEAENGESTSTR